MKYRTIYDQTQSPGKWPDPIGEAAFTGAAGKIIRTIEPHSEADPAALLIQFLVFFGNTINRSAYFQVEADKQHTNLNTVIVGQSAKARKGTSLGHIKKIFEILEPEYMQRRLLSGLSSGEGLIASVRDQVVKDVRDEKTGVVGPKVIDEGVTDKRALVVETEFASAMQALRRDGNKLSAVVRDCWDHGNLSVLVKNDPIKATDAHVSIVGHVTEPELKKYLGDVELFNGFANRFIWIVARRSKFLPFGGAFRLADHHELLAQIRDAIQFGRCTGEVLFDENAKFRWEQIYFSLTDEKPGLLGALTARAEATILRIGTIYALLDKSKYMRECHLEAAMAVWKYAEASTFYIFGDSTGDRYADLILENLRQAPLGLTRTQINHDVLKRNVRKGDLQLALDTLVQTGRAYSESGLNESGNECVVWKAADQASPTTSTTSGR